MERDTPSTTRHVRRDTMVAAVAAGMFFAITAALAVDGPLLDLDLAVRTWSEAHRPSWVEQVARVLNRLGQGFWFMVVSFILAGWAGWRRLRGGAGRWSAAQPALYVCAATVLVVPTVLLAKAVIERGAPSSPLPPTQTVELFGSLPPGEYATGYPGGHATNSVVWYGVMLALVITLLRVYGREDPPRAARALVRVAPPVIVFGVSTYLSFHWLTDGLAGLALGLTVDRALAALRPYWWGTVP